MALSCCDARSFDKLASSLRLGMYAIVVVFSISRPLLGQPLIQPPNWRLTFRDEFDGSELDRSKWNSQNAFGVIINNELQGYADEAVRVAGGILQLHATRRPTKYHGKTLPFRSGIVTTKDKFFQKYGFFEIRCRLPKGQGLWPTFWTLLQRPDDSQEWPPEIDIVEALGSHPNKVTFNSHYKDENGQNQNNYGEVSGPDFTAKFHVYSCHWRPNEIIWYVDGIERHRARLGVPQEPMYVLVNLAVGGKFPNAVGAPPDETTPDHAVMEVDYVRVYERTD